MLHDNDDPMWTLILDALRAGDAPSAERLAERASEAWDCSSLEVLEEAWNRDIQQQRAS